MRINHNGIERDMTADEEKAHLIWLEQTIKEETAAKDEKTAKQIARQAVLDKLGLTADEAQALLG